MSLMARVASSLHFAWASVLSVAPAWLRGWQPTAPSAPAPVTAIPVPTTQVQPRVAEPLAVASEDGDRSGLSAVWSFRANILDKLDDYFDCMRHLRRADPDSYALFSRVGFTIPATGYWNGDHIEANHRVQRAPKRSFGGVLVPPANEASSVTPSFMYFRRMVRPSGVQQTRGDVFRLVVVFDDRSRRRRLHGVCECYVAVLPCGTVCLLKQRMSISQPIPARLARQFGGRHRRVSSWAFPEWLQSWAADHGKTPSQMVSGIFLMAFLTHDEALSRVVVRALRQGVTAAFGIDVATAKKFFADRETDALALDGKRKRIFHAVVSHERQLPDGRTSSVKAHFRGIRHFNWKGSQIAIVLPSNRVLDIDVPGEEAASLPREKSLGSAELGERIAMAASE